MRVLFVIPPYRTTDGLFADCFPMPLAPVLLGAILKQAGHEVHIEDFLLPMQKQIIAKPESFKGLRSPPYTHWGRPLEECESWLEANISGYDVVCLALGQCNIWEGGAAIAKKVRELGKPLVVGGPLASTDPSFALKVTGATVLVRGEADEVIAEVVERAVAMDKTGASGCIVEGTPPFNLNALPEPDWSLAPPATYPRACGGRVRGVLSTSRGCPYRCSFCSVHAVHGRAHRRCDREHIKRQIINLANYGVEYFCFVDDNLFINEAKTDEVLAAIADARAVVGRAGKRWRFYVEEGVDVKIAAVPGLLAQVAAAGFVNIALGLETMNASRLEENRKPCEPEQLKAAAAEARKAGIEVKAFYLVGFPGDTPESVAFDLMALSKLGFAIRVNNVKLYPGTDMTEQFKREGLIGKDYDWRKSSFHTPDSKDLKYKDVLALRSYLGAVGYAGAELGLDVFAAKGDEIIGGLGAVAGMTVKDDWHELTVSGNMYRPAPVARLAALVMLRRFGGVKIRTIRGENLNTTITVTGQDEALDRVQLALKKAMYGIEQPSLFEAPKPVPEFEGAPQ